MDNYPGARALIGMGLLLVAGILTVAILVAVLGSAASAQTPTEAGNGTQDECTQHIDRFVSLCSAEIVDGEVVLELESDANQQVVVTDAAGVMEGGRVTRESFVIRGRSTVRMPITTYDGIAAVTVDTGRVLYAIPLEERESWFQGEADWSTAQVAGAGGTIGALVVVGVVAWRRRDGGRHDVRRRA